MREEMRDVDICIYLYKQSNNYKHTKYSIKVDLILILKIKLKFKKPFFEPDPNKKESLWPKGGREGHVYKFLGGLYVCLSTQGPIMAELERGQGDALGLSSTGKGRHT